MSREGGMEFEDKICCVAPGKRNVSRDSPQQFYISYIILWIGPLALMMVA